MCLSINAACLIANVFEVCSSRDEFLLNDIGLLVLRLDRELESYKIAIDWTKPSVMEAFALYSDLFTMTCGNVKKASSFSEFSSAGFIENEFNHSFSKPVVKVMRNMISHAFLGR
jgi:hypothetical protein